MQADILRFDIRCFFALSPFKSTDFANLREFETLKMPVEGEQL